MRSLSLSIRSRLGLVIGLLWLLLALVSAIAYTGFQELSRTANELVDRDARLAILATRTNQHAQSAALHLMRLLLTTDREQRVALYASMDEALNTADQALKQLENHTSHRLAPEVTRVRELRDRYGDAFQATVEQIELDGPMSALEHFETVTEPALKQLLAGTDMLAVKLQDTMQAEAEGLTDESTTARQRIVLIGLFALLAGVLLAVWVARRILRPVNAAAAFADQMAAGNYQGPIPLASADEIGSMLKALALMRDRIAEREVRIRRIAYVDELTDLANRAQFFEGFEQAGIRHGALLLVDIDRFSAINKALGHAVGDALLRGVAQRLRATVGEHDLLARLWGDEFALFLCDADGAKAAIAAQHIREALREPLEIDGQRLDLEASVGIALLPDDGSDLPQVLRRADLALRRAKQRHLGMTLATDVPQEPAPAHLSLMGDMRQALAQDQFRVHYQPKMDLASGDIVGAEALIRWQHPVRGLVPPGHFIPFAEQTGFIREITPWLIKRVVADAALWRQQGIALVISANLSAHDLGCGDQLVQGVIDALAQAQLPPEALCLEITESALMDEPEAAMRHLERLSALGVKLAIDDYGSGMASLSYVKDLPVNELKIDRVFVSGVNHTPKNAAIVKSTLLLCRELGLSVVAEGAETQEEIAWLAAQGCDQVQGYGVAKPMPHGVFTDWLIERKTR
jgi:diguanylate cyclase (GGDEF)-like protein